MRDLACGNYRVYLEFEQRRVYCRNCQSVKSERLDFLADSPFYTKRFAYYVGRRCAKETVKDDYYQLSLESERSDKELKTDFEQTGPYLLLQTQFEFSSGGKCYVESNDDDYIGHFELKLIEFTPVHLVFEIVRDSRNRVEVDFTLTVPEFEDSRHIVEVIFGLKEPSFEDEF